MHNCIHNRPVVNVNNRAYRKEGKYNKISVLVRSDHNILQLCCGVCACVFKHKDVNINFARRIFFSIVCNRSFCENTMIEKFVSPFFLFLYYRKRHLVRSRMKTSKSGDSTCCIKLLSCVNR